jgi:hypothetical protein
MDPPQLFEPRREAAAISPPTRPETADFNRFIAGRSEQPDL